MTDLATRQHGVVARRQLLAIGCARSSLDRAVDAGRLHRIHRGVYAVGHKRLTPRGRCMAAVLACGSRALLSHRSAAWLWGLIPTCSTRMEVTVPSRGHRRHDIWLHHAPSLTSDDTAVVDAIPVTSVARTLLDLAAVSPARLDRALEQAERLELFDLRSVESLLERHGKHRGASRLRHAITLYKPVPFTRSELERRFLNLVEEAGLPTPTANAFVAGYEVDMHWPASRLVVELDGFEHHRTRAAFERDRRRDEDLKLAGFDVVRLTARRIAEDPAGMRGLLAVLLAAG